MKRGIKRILAIALILVAILTSVACGRVDFSINFVVDGEVYDTVSTGGREIIEMPENPTKDGYIFDGWYLDKDAWEKPFDADCLLDAPLSSDMSVYAKWEELLNDDENGSDTGSGEGSDTGSGEGDENPGDTEDVKYTISFETNGGTTIAPQTVSVIESSPATTKEYNTLVAWYTDASLKESAMVSFPFTPTADVTLYAKWSVDFSEGLQMTLQAGSESYFVTGYTGTESVVVIPATYNDIPVTGIDTRAFAGNSIIRDVVIPDSVTTIGKYAFSVCESLKGVTIPDSVTTIYEWIFYNCANLTIYCVAESQPDGWRYNWNSGRPVEWGYKETE